MKKFRYFLLFFITIYPKAQNPDNMVLPDSVGKYIYQLFINRIDIATSDLIIVDSDHYSTRELWASLMKCADDYQLNDHTTEYFNTYYQSYNYVSDQGDKMHAYTLYIGVNADDEVYAIKAEVSWNGQKWEFLRLYPEIYLYGRDYYHDYQFSPYIELNEQHTDYNFNKSGNVNTRIDGKRIAPPVLPFADKFLQSILNDQPIESDMLPSETQYMEFHGNSVIKKLKYLVENNTDIVGEEDDINAVLKNPSLLYKMEINDGLKALPEALKEKFETDDISFLLNYETDINVTNWSYKFGFSNTRAYVDILLSNGNKKAGIHFGLILCNGVWKLNNVQGFPSSIQEAEKTQYESDDFPGEIDIITK